MKKVILFLLLVPVSAFSQIVNRIDPGKIVITEVMADPLPSISLPAEEYLEIFNASESTVDLTGWLLHGDSQTYPFPSVQISPRQYLILCHISDTALFRKFGSVAPFKSFPALNNDGKLLVVTDMEGQLVNGVEYSDKWYGNSLKSEGGWSLELVDIQYPFFGEGNWKASTSREGGTPGAPNSVDAANPDTYFLGIENAYASDSLTVILSVSEPLPKGLMPEEVEVNGTPVTSIYSTDKLNRKFTAKSEEPLRRRNVYTVSINNSIKDFAGNTSENPSFQTGIPESPCCNDLSFNEILFDPLPGGCDFIELYNNSDKLIDLSQVYLASVNGTDTSALYSLSAGPIPLLPGGTIAFTTDRYALSVLYPSSELLNIKNIPSLPSMPDAGGTLVLFSRNLERLDVLIYSPEMHNTILASSEGVSLEKIRHDMQSSVKGNWHSASGTSGWATPGAVNSLFSESFDNGSQISLSSSRITPDYDGIDDVITVYIRLTGDNNAISVNIYDVNGSLVRKVAENLFCGPSGSVVWDGSAEDGSYAPSGIYIIYIESFDEKGSTGHWKEAVSLIRRR